MRSVRTTAFQNPQPCCKKVYLSPGDQREVVNRLVLRFAPLKRLSISNSHAGHCAQAIPQPLTHSCQKIKMDDLYVKIAMLHSLKILHGQLSSAHRAMTTVIADDNSVTLPQKRTQYPRMNIDKTFQPCDPFLGFSICPIR